MALTERILPQHIEPGKRYAIRERVAIDEPLQRVEVLEKVRGSKWKVRFVGSLDLL